MRRKRVQGSLCYQGQVGWEEAAHQVSLERQACVRRRHQNPGDGTALGAAAKGSVKRILTRSINTRKAGDGSHLCNYPYTPVFFKV